MNRKKLDSLDPMKQLDKLIFAEKDPEVIYANDFINHLVDLVLNHAVSDSAASIDDNKAS